MGTPDFDADGFNAFGDHKLLGSARVFEHDLTVLLGAATWNLGRITPRVGVAEVLRTLLPIVAIDIKPHACAAGTFVQLGACIAVITLRHVGVVRASCSGVAAIVCTKVAIIATDNLSLTVSVGAGIFRRAGVVVAARLGVVLRQTTNFRVAGIVRAGVAIRAINEDSQTLSVCTGILGGARATIVAIDVVRNVRASYCRVTPVVGAWIAIVAGESHLARDARTVLARIPAGTGIAVVACQGIGRI